MEELMRSLFSWEGVCAALTSWTYFDSAKHLPDELHPWFNLATIATFALCIFLGKVDAIAGSLYVIATETEEIDDFTGVEHPPYELEDPENGDFNEE
jgi:hypothetical protein